MQHDYHLKQEAIYRELAALARNAAERCRYLDLAAFHATRSEGGEASPGADRPGPMIPMSG